MVGLGGRIQKLTLTAQTQVGLLAAGVARAIPGIRTIRAAGATERETDVLDGLAGDAYGTGIRLAKVMALIAPIIGIALQGAFIAVLGVGGYLVADGAMQVAAAGRVHPLPVHDDHAAGPGLPGLHGDAERAGRGDPDPGDHLAAGGGRPAVRSPAEPVAAVAGRGRTRLAAPAVEAAVSFDGVSFGYGDAPVLQRREFHRAGRHQDRDRRAVRGRQVDDPRADRAVLRPGRRA